MGCAFILVIKSSTFTVFTWDKNIIHLCWYIPRNLEAHWRNVKPKKWHKTIVSHYRRWPEGEGNVMVFHWCLQDWSAIKHGETWIVTLLLTAIQRLLEFSASSTDQGLWIHRIWDIGQGNELGKIRGPGAAETGEWITQDSPSTLRAGFPAAGGGDFCKPGSARPGSSHSEQRPPTVLVLGIHPLDHHTVEGEQDKEVILGSGSEAQWWHVGN